jgi:hypothetical protein
VCAVQDEVYELEGVGDIGLLLVQPPHPAADAVCCCCCGLDAIDELFGIGTGELQELWGAREAGPSEDREGKHIWVESEQGRVQSGTCQAGSHMHLQV